MKVTVKLVDIEVLGTVPVKGLEDLKKRGKVETIQTTALLKSARIHKRKIEK